MPNGFRKPKELDVTEGLDRPTLSVRQFDADDEHAKAAKVSEKAHQRDRETLGELDAATTDVITDALRAPMPDRDATARELEDRIQEVMNDWQSHRSDLAGYLANRASEAEEQLPDLTDGRPAPGESDTRRWIREADNPEERTKRLRQVVESGNVAQARALFRDSVPARAAGFGDEGQRQRMMQDALRAANAEAYETRRALMKELEALTRDGALIEQYSEKLRQKAMAVFDRVVAEHAARE